MAITQRTLFNGQGDWLADNIRESTSYFDDGKDLVGFFFVYNDAAGTNLAWDLSLQVRMPDGSTWVPWLGNGDPTDDPAMLVSNLSVASTGIQDRYVNFADPTDSNNRQMHGRIRLPPGKWRVQVTATNGANADQLTLVGVLAEGVA